MSSNKMLLLVGAKGMLAQKVIEKTEAEFEVVGVDLPEFDIIDREQVDGLIETVRPDVIINCAAFTNVDGCEEQEEVATRVNGTAVGFLAEAAKEVGATFVHISTDYVFPGNGSVPLIEDDLVAPQSAYGRSKLAGEKAILNSGLEKYFILRTSWLYGPGGRNFVETIIRLAREREEIGIVADQQGSPTYTGDLANAILNLLKLTCHNSYGLYHFSNEGSCSWYDFAVEIVKCARGAGEELKVKEIKPIRTEDYPLPAKRPAYSVFSKQKYKQLTGANIPHWQESLETYFEQRKRLQ